MSNNTGAEFGGAYNSNPSEQLNNTINYAQPDRGAYNSSLVGGNGNHGGHTSSKHMSELDIAKIVAQKYAKQAHADATTNYSGQVKEEFRNVYKVWSAFVKFIRAQTTGKQKMVDTTFIGHLHKRDDEPVNSTNLELLVSQEFFEAGKFKNKQLPNFNKSEELIKSYKDQGRLIQVNPATIGFVCNLNKNVVHKILTDFFSAFIELSRRTQNEVILDFKVGNLHLYKNGELFFESKSETDNAMGSPTKRAEPREDISVIDSASAILSTGGGRVMSIKSSYLENLSVRTPQSQYSKANSLFSQRSASNHHKLVNSQNWLKYRMRKNYESAQRNAAANDYKDDAPAPLEEELQKQSIPYPFLSAFIERRTGQRFSKRVKFDPSQTDQEKFLQQIINQINTNSDKKEAQKQVKREEDQEFLANLRQKMLLDLKQVSEDKRQKQLDFIQANEALKQQKQTKNEYETQEKINYKPTYFPFTHGESVLHQRQAWREMQQADLAILAKQEAFSPIKRKPLNTLKPEELHLIFTNATGSGRDSPLKLTQDFLSVSATPGGSYLRPNYPYKVKHTDTMARTMDGAWKRFEDQLRKEEEQKRRLAENFHNAVVRDQQAIDAEIIRKMAVQEETRKELEKQMFYKDTVREMEEIERRRKEKTSFGPEESGILYEVLDQRRSQAREATKKDLEQLMKERAERGEFVDKLERSLDHNMVQQTIQAYHDEQRERKALDYQRKQDFKNAWIEQALINEKVRTIDNLFN